MKNFLLNLGSLLLVILLVILAFCLGFGIVGGIVYCMSLLLRWLLPLSLFESLVISALLTWMTGLVANAIMGAFKNNGNSLTRFPSSDGSSSDAMINLDEPALSKISTSRFYKSNSERTWEAWFTSEIANDVYADFQIDPQPVTAMNESQRQALAIRLAELGVSILKRKTGGSRNLQVNANALRRELERNQQKPYDADLIAVAVDAINANVDYYEDELMNVIRSRLWAQVATDIDE